MKRRAKILAKRLSSPLSVFSRNENAPIDRKSLRVNFAVEAVEHDTYGREEYDRRLGYQIPEMTLEELQDFVQYMLNEMKLHPRSRDSVHHKYGIVSQPFHHCCIPEHFSSRCPVASPCRSVVSW
jgi:hypothetical protein